jgi:hypothetical protein
MTVVIQYSSASPGRPADTSSSTRRPQSLGTARRLPGRMNTGSHNASLETGSPRAAASRAMLPVPEMPIRAAAPPASAITAARSSYSRSTEYGGVSPLSPRPRRS